MLRIGIIREGKVPPDSRVAIIPEQCKWIEENYNIQFKVQRSEGRCYSNEEYENQGIELVDEVLDCDILMGVKEVPIDLLIDNKTYFFFSHTIKMQSYNQKLLKACVNKNIRLIDYEVLTNDKGQRLIAFGVFAGMVGAHNALYTYSQRSQSFAFKRMKDYFEYKDAVADYQKTNFPAIKIVLTGTGRVGSGAKKVLDDMGIREVNADDFIHQSFDEAVYCQLGCKEYVCRKDKKEWIETDFFNNPKDFESAFAPFYQVADIMINGIYWDNEAPQFFTKDDMKNEDFNIKVIADVTCDIAPVSSIPSTLFASTIAEPIFGYNPQTEQEDQAHQNHVIDMMTIDNLPNELPRDASKAFGQQFIDHVLEEIIKEEKSIVLQRASVAQDGDLGSHFEYLRNYLNGGL